MDSVHDPAALERFRRRHRVDPHALRLFRNAFYKHGRTLDEAACALPAHAAAALPHELACDPLALESRHDSAVDGASRLILATRAGHRVEAVILRIASGRTSLCVSSQVGCAAACSFCATGRMGLRANLSAAEIVDQLLIANRLLRAERRAVRNVVFMGMGEPLHNEAALSAALDLLTAKDGCAHPDSRILVSTVGVPDALVRLAERFPRVRLALSLHAARPEVRARIVPLEARHPLAEVRAALVRVATLQQGRPIMLEIVLLRGVNDAPQDAAAIIEFARGLCVHVNLIPWNTVDDVDLAGTERAGQLRFARQLKDAGLTVTLRYSLGSDVAAACGQLVRGEPRGLTARS